MLNYEAILDGADLCSWDWNLVTNEVRYDKRWCASIGRSVDEVLHEFSTWEEFVHPDDKARALKDVANYLEGRSPFYENIHRLKHRDGRWIWVLARARFGERNEAGVPQTLTGTHFDITYFMEQKILAENLEMIAHIGSWEFEPKTGKLTLSKEVYKILGLEENTQQSLTLTDFKKYYALAEHPRLDRFFTSCLQGQAFREVFECFNAEKKHLWVITSAQPCYNADEQVYKITGTFQDIDEFKNSLNSFDAIIQSIDDIILEVNPEHEVLNLWTKREDLLFAPKKEVIGQSLAKFLPSELYHKFASVIKECKNSNTTLSIDYKHPYQPINREPIWFKAKFFWQKNSKTQDLYTIVISDISQEVLARENLKSQGERLRVIVENSPGVVFQFKLINKEKIEMSFFSDDVSLQIGYTAAELYQDSSLLTDILHEDERSNFYHLISDSAKNLTTLEWEGKMYRKDKSLIWVKIKGRPLKLEDDSILWNAVLIDITDEVKREHEMAQQKKSLEHHSKLATLGEMVAGIGHEINNPLAIAKGQLEELLESLDQSEETTSSKKIQKIQLALSRIEQIVGGLRVFSRAADSELIKFNLVEKVEEALEMLANIYLKEGVHINFDYEQDKDSYHILGNPGRIQQVLVNLLNNAKDATDGMNNREISIHLCHKDKFVECLISDNGVGISKENQEKIFAPFFTTKPLNKGTGIGLSLCYKIIEEHQGKISFKSVLNQGTNFMICLKTYEGDNLLTQNKPDSTKRVETASKVVLVVEDEEDLREYIASRLHKFGHTVHQASDGLDALRIIDLHQNKIDLVISDIQMPKLNGPGLLEKIRRNQKITRQPKFVFCTGGTNIDLSSYQSDNELKIDGYLYKPFSRDDIKELISKIFT